MAERTCSVDGCDKESRKRGWCVMHYARWQKNGDPLVVSTVVKVLSDPLTRFWSRVDRTGDCWLWTGSVNRRGYGQIYIDSDRPAVKAHRYAWELENGPIPAGMFICHRCDNPPCVRLDHLFVGTPADNYADMAAKGRNIKQVCHRGHALNAANCYITPGTGRRKCRTCRTIIAQRRRERERHSTAPTS